MVAQAELKGCDRCLNDMAGSCCSKHIWAAPHLDGILQDLTFGFNAVPMYEAQCRNLIQKPRVLNLQYENTPT